MQVRIRAGEEKKRFFSQSNKQSDKNNSFYKIVRPAQVQKFLKHAMYPTYKEELMHEAEEEGADTDVVFTLAEIPKGKYRDSLSVNKAIEQLMD